MKHINFLDILLGIPLIWALYKGFCKGLIIEIASLVALLLGIYCSIHFSSYVSDYLISTFSLKTPYMPVISFAITFLVIVIIVYTLAFIIEKLVDVVSLSLANKLAGAIFGMLKAAFILSIILYLINVVDTKKSFISDSKRNSSYLYRPVSNLAVKFAPDIKKIDILNKPFNIKTEIQNLHDKL